MSSHPTPIGSLRWLRRELGKQGLETASSVSEKQRTLVLRLRFSPCPSDLKIARRSTASKQEKQTNDLD
jgi:hypothetical protein